VIRTCQRRERRVFRQNIYNPATIWGIRASRFNNTIPASAMDPVAFSLL
jgi:hypothetical protein